MPQPHFARHYTEILDAGLELSFSYTEVFGSNVKYS